MRKTVGGLGVLGTLQLDKLPEGKYAVFIFIGADYVRLPFPLSAEATGELAFTTFEDAQAAIDGVEIRAYNLFTRQGFETRYDEEQAFVWDEVDLAAVRAKMEEVLSKIRPDKEEE